MAQVVHSGAEGYAERLVRNRYHVRSQLRRKQRHVGQTVSGSGSTATAPSSAAGNGSTAKSDTAAGASSANQTSVASGAVTKSEYSQLAQTGIGISVACAIILALSGLAYAVKMFVQYKRETAE